MMDLELIERLMIMLEKSALDTLDVEEGGMRIRLSKAGAVLPSKIFEEEVSGASAEQGHVVIAGLSGTFYKAPAPGAEPYVRVGDSIHEGQVLGLVEAMKMLNPVEADRDGIVDAVLVDDAQPVLPGQPLFRLVKAHSDV